MKIAPVQKQTKAGQRTRFRVRTVLSIPLLAFRPFCHVRDAKHSCEAVFSKMMTKNPARRMYMLVPVYELTCGVFHHDSLLIRYSPRYPVATDQTPS